MTTDAAAMLEVVRTLPEHTASVTLRSPRGAPTRRFGGALLYDYCRAVQMVPRRQGPVVPGNHYLLATAVDGAQVTISWFEVMPRSSGKQILLAYEQDGEPVRAGLRLVVPGDDLGGRSITGVASLELRRDAEAEGAGSSPERIELAGAIERPASLTLADLEGFAQHEVVMDEMVGHDGERVPERRFSGALLWDVIDAAGIIVDPAINEDILRRIVFVRGADGRTAAIAPGEIEPRFMAGQALIATHCEGEPLPASSGAFRLVLPYDRAEGRAIKQLASIEVRLG